MSATLLLAGTALAAAPVGRPTSTSPVRSHVSASATAGVAPPAETYEPTTGATFNDPTGTEEEQYRIIRHINDLIDHSPPGSVIRIASMTLNQRSTIDALLAAYARGVDVRIILPAAMRAKPGPVSVTAVLGSNKSASSYIFFCTNSCYRSGTSGVHHSKLHLFSQVGTATNVVSTSSGNLDDYMAQRRYNDEYTVVDDTQGYRAAVTYFDGMLRDADGKAAAPTTTSEGITYYFFPRRRANLFGGIFKFVQCTGATGGTGVNGRTAIRMTTSLWDRSRLDVAQQLVSLRRKGCNIQITAQSYNIDAGIVRMFRDARVSLRYSNSPSMASGSHSKYVAISGNFHGKSNATSVYAGSLNLTAADNSVCDNNMVRITQAPAFEAYRRQFTGLWAKSVPANQSSRALRTFTADKTAIAQDDQRRE